MQTCPNVVGSGSLAAPSQRRLGNIAEDTFNAEIADMHQYFNWSADTRLFLGTSGGSTEAGSTFKVV